MSGHCRVILTVILSLLTAPVAAQTVFQTAAEIHESYPDLPGRDLALGFCSACHGFRIVAVQGMSRPQWEASLTWMTRKHNMPELDPADRETILNYLAAAFPPKATPGGRTGWTSPFTPRP
jgi:mono/diheme cytochrome c family protein